MYTTMTSKHLGLRIALATSMKGLGASGFWISVVTQLQSLTDGLFLGAAFYFLILFG